MSFEYIKNKFPTDDGFCMPAEFSKHSATVMIWPERPGSWCYEAKFAEKVFIIYKKIYGRIKSGGSDSYIQNRYRYSIYS